MSPFSRAEFLLAAGRAADFPGEGPPELVFAGRSNVGKSSAINALAGRRRLAFTSKTPGRTQTINFYRLADGSRLVDLPGYGFARAPRELRSSWERLVGAYLRSRVPVAVVLVLDARHPLTPLDAQLLGWLGEARLLVLLSKADKLNRREREDALARTRRGIDGRDEARLQLFSALSREGVEQARELLEGWLAAENKKPPVKGM